MNELRIASFCRRRVGPFYRGSCFVVVPDVTKDFSAEILDGGEHASGDELPLDLGEQERAETIDADRNVYLLFSKGLSGDPPIHARDWLRVKGQSRERGETGGAGTLRSVATARSALPCEKGDPRRI
jgi:hypothetical protein